MSISLTKLPFLTLLLMYCFHIYCQIRVGAPNEAIGNATSTISSIWSGWHNPAGISGQQQVAAGISYRAIQDIGSFNTAGFAIALPIKVGAFGLGISRFGDALFNEQQLSLSYGNKFGITDLGIRLAYHQYHFEGFGNKGVPIVSFGGITTIHKEFLIGASIQNIHQAKISNFQEERIPTIMQLGVSYRPLENIAIHVDLEKDIEFQASVLVGISYVLVDNFMVKSGFNTNPLRQFFGLCFYPNNRKGIFSYTTSHQKFFGLSHQVSIQYNLTNKK